SHYHQRDKVKDKHQDGRQHLPIAASIRTNRISPAEHREHIKTLREGANKRGNSSRLTQSFHFFMFEPIFSPVNALNQPI
ncbi:hypothetical protein, partial [Aeromonas dhakensis]|uniref:hypothetical protein n=1 Tax=Aeromonas dhakensis TaxID=196024 RepID=UPI0019574900